MKMHHLKEGSVVGTDSDETGNVVELCYLKIVSCLY